MGCTTSQKPCCAEGVDADVGVALDTGLSHGLCQHLKVGHIALVVRDVGISLDFYSNIVGLRQIQRPNFDRHGAWLSMGNMELHLIKGIPHTHRGQHPADLIVSHLAVEVPDVAAVSARLKQLQDQEPDLNLRQNVSVPSKETSLTARFESDHTCAEGMVTQFFLEDPDGYWLEICDCHGSHEISSDSSTAMSLVSGKTSMAGLFKMVVSTLRWLKCARGLVSSRYCKGLKELDSLIPVLVDEVDETKFSNLLQRRNTYGDICQGFSEPDLQAVLAKAGNNVPGAMLILRRMYETANLGQVHKPPSFLSFSSVPISTKTFRMDGAEQIKHPHGWTELDDAN